MSLVFILVFIIIFIIVASSTFKLHPFLTLILASFITALACQLPMSQIAHIINQGFGNILSYIGLVIVLGTIIGTILEKSGAAITMADVVIKLLGKRYPTLTMSIIGYLVSIPVFCDSGFVILNALKQSMAERMQISSVAMSIALATGLFATHTFVPPTPGPIAAAGNLGLSAHLGLVIGLGLIISAIAAIAGILWANQFTQIAPDGDIDNQHHEPLKEPTSQYPQLPSPLGAFSPIFIPIFLICVGSIAQLPINPFGQGGLFEILITLGQPVNALIIGLFISLTLLKGKGKIQQLSQHVSHGLTLAAPILLITGAGGAFGAVLNATPIGDFLGSHLSQLGLGLFMPFIVAAALKSAQGSSTVALVTTSAMVAPMLDSIGLSSDMGRALTVMAIGSGAMTVSHANDSFFWVVTQFSHMSVKQAYKAQTLATLIQGLVSITFIYLLSLLLL
ncbi:GntP family permease [uncultured Shewanella sp.]|uniref:GntP family permease n=1 Tax=uncultured Shewanella sp. TaxID=173975 RepID=UPI00261A4F81|nr:GntP family permease [uncultured Shewanella sp.]